MRHLNRLGRVGQLLVCALLSLSLPWSFVSAAPAGDTSVAAEIDHSNQLVQLLGQIGSVAADYAQVTLNKNGEVVQQFNGRLSVNGPGRFRLESMAPTAQTLVSDGVSFWSYDSDLEQVIITPLQHDMTQVPILLLGGDASAITASYRVDYGQHDGQEIYRLEPLDASSLFDSLTLVFMAGQPRAITLRDSLGQRTQIELSGVVLNQPIADEVFTFTPPAGVDVIDDR